MHRMPIVLKLGWFVVLLTAVLGAVMSGQYGGVDPALVLALIALGLVVAAGLAVRLMIGLTRRLLMSAAATALLAYVAHALPS